MRVILDTNVLVSALLKKSSTPHKIYQLFKEQKFTLIISPVILYEIEEVISRDYIVKRTQMTRSEREEFMRELIELSYIVPGVTQVKVIKEDPDDDKFIAAALDGMANYIVSGDRHLLDLKEYQGIKIVTPGQFIEELQNYDTT